MSCDLWEVFIMGCICCKQRKNTKSSPISNTDTCGTGGGAKGTESSRYIPDPTQNSATGLIPNFNDFPNTIAPTSGFTSSSFPSNPSQPWATGITGLFIQICVFKCGLILKLNSDALLILRLMINFINVCVFYYRRRYYSVHSAIWLWCPNGGWPVFSKGRKIPHYQ